MHNAQSILYIAAVAISGFCLALTLLCRKHIKEFPHFLIVFIALQSLGFISQVLLHAPLAPAKHLWMFLAITHAFILGPVIYLFALEVNGQENPSISQLGRIKIALTIIGLLMASPVLIMVHSGTDWVSGFHPSSELFWKAYYALATGYVGLYFALSCNYFWRVLKIVKIADKRWLSLSAVYKGSVNESVKIQVLRVIAAGFAVSIFINMSRAITCSLFGPNEIVSQAQSVADILVSVCVLLVVIKKMIQGGFVTQVQTEGAIQGLVNKYERSPLDAENRERIRRKISASLGDKAIYTDNSLTLNKLAMELGEKHHYVSQVINQELKSSFFDLVNKQRVLLAQQMLESESQLAIIDIAESVGFNSKSTFYSAFSKFVGMTPAEFRKGSKS